MFCMYTLSGSPYNGLAPGSATLPSPDTTSTVPMLTLQDLMAVITSPAPAAKPEKFSALKAEEASAIVPPLPTYPRKYAV